MMKKSAIYSKNLKLNNPYLIAEISANHNGSIDRAKKLILCAKKNGADAAKLQTYTPEGMTLDSNNNLFKIKEGLWKGYTLFELYKKASTPHNWHKELFDFGKKIGLTIFSTPFDEHSLSLLENLNCPFYKIASFEMTDHELISKIAKTKKPLIISTGMATISEIESTVHIAKKNGCKDLTLLYCVSKYPACSDDFNLHNISVMKEKFKCRVGFSDHSKDNRIAISSVSLGAEVIEKHIALDRQKKGFDIEFSLKGKEFYKLRQDINIAYQLTKEKSFKRKKSEDKSLIFRRSIFAIKDIKKNEIFTKDNIKIIRPGYGIDPSYYSKLLKKKSPISIKKEKPIPKDIISIIKK